MKKYSNIPDPDNILRWAKWMHLEKDHDGNVIGCFHDLFKLREKEENLSVNWVEFFEGDEEEQLDKCVGDFRNGLESKKIPPKSAFAKLAIGAVKKLCKTRSANIRVLYEPTKNIKSHSAIRQLPQDDSILFEDLCNLAFKTLIPAKKFIKGTKNSFKP